MSEHDSKPCPHQHTETPATDRGLRIDAHLSLPVLISWITGLLVFVATVSGVFAEQHKRLDYTENRQQQLEQTIKNIESMISQQNALLIRLAAKMEASETK